MKYHIKADNETRSFNANASKNPNEKSHQSTSRKKYIRYWWIFVDTFIKRSFKTDGDMGGLWNSLTVVRMSKLSINQRDADIYHISICLRWLPTVLPVCTPEEGWRTKNELLVSPLGLSAWHSQWRLVTHLGILFHQYEYVADCCHGNRQS